MTDYVLGFMFDSSRTHILLMEKKRPEFQAGKLNGVGGKIEHDETPLQAMIRESREETGLFVKQWRHYATLKFPDDDRVFVFSSMSSMLGDLERAVDAPPTDEPLCLLSVKHVAQGQPDNAMGNLQWLVPMCLDGGFKQPLLVEYHERNGRI